jgi:hypothetical protein
MSLTTPGAVRPRKNEGSTPRVANITMLIFEEITETAVFKLKKEACLPYEFVLPRLANNNLLYALEC